MSGKSERRINRMIKKNYKVQFEYMWTMMIEMQFWDRFRICWRIMTKKKEIREGL
jgi:hypothetical protein